VKEFCLRWIGLPGMQGNILPMIEALRSKLRRIFDPSEEQTIRLCSVTPQQAAGNGSLADSGKTVGLGLGKSSGPMCFESTVSARFAQRRPLLNSLGLTGLSGK
jgi:hypothetical protein